MTNRSEIERIVYRAIDRMNDMLLDDSTLAKDPGTALIGDKGQLDSLGFINFVVAVEDEASQAMTIDISLADELILRGDAARPETVGDVIDFVWLLAREAQART